MIPRLLAAAVLLTALWAAAPAADESGPMTEEDVVRRVVAGVPTETILQEIRTRPVAFALDDEMLAELEAAGVPDVVRRAMIERAAELAPASEPPPAEPVADPREQPLAALRIALHGAGRGDDPARLRLRGKVGFEMRRGLALDAALEGQPFEDVALFLICLTPTHVPDHWRDASPLGRDFAMPRHRMLTFVAHAQHRGSDADEPLLELDLPPSIEVALAPGEAHDLWLGVALSVGGRYYHLTHDALDELTLDGDRDLRAEVASSKRGEPGRIAVKLEPEAPPG